MFRLIAIMLLSSTTASADRRLFTNTYTYSTVPEGRTAVELWHTQTRDTWDRGSPQRFEQIVELEHGLTDHWDAAMYTVFAQVSASDPMVAKQFGLDSVRVETRYRLADRAEWPVDTLLYFEAAKDFGQSIYELEGKVIAARDFDRLLVAANAIIELELGRDAKDSGLALGWAAGASYELHPKLNLGAETWGVREDDATDASVGPVLAVAPSSNFWLTFTAGFGLTDKAAKFAARAIVGIEL